jgi:hypothetical protein
MGTALVRRGNGAILAVTATVLLLAAGLGAYGRHAIVDERAFADRAVAALERPDVRAEVALRLAAQRPELAAAIDAAVRDPRFEPAFRAGAARMHRALFGGGEEVRFDIAGMGALVPAAGVEAPTLLTVGGGGALERELRAAAPPAGGAAPWWPVALVPALALLVLAGRRRAGLAIAAAGAVAGAGSVVAEALLLRTFTSRHGDAVVDAVWDSYLADLRTAGLLVAALGFALAVRWRSPWPRARAGRRAGATSPAGSSTQSLR